MSITLWAPCILRDEIDVFHFLGCRMQTMAVNVGAFNVEWRTQKPGTLLMQNEFIKKEFVSDFMNETRVTFALLSIERMKMSFSSVILMPGLCIYPWNLKLSTVEI